MIFPKPCIMKNSMISHYDSRICLLFDFRKWWRLILDINKSGMIFPNPLYNANNMISHYDSRICCCFLFQKMAAFDFGYQHFEDEDEEESDFGVSRAYESR